MTEIEKLQRAKLYMDKLANGIDPITDRQVPEDSALNNVRLSRCFFYVADILRQVLENGGTETPNKASKKTAQAAFWLSAEQREAFICSAEPISISVLVGKINGMIDAENMKKLAATAVTNWLLSGGYLRLTESNGRKSRQPTMQGNAVGILTDPRQGQYGEYNIVLYNERAQRFVLDHLDEIIGALSA